MARTPGTIFPAHTPTVSRLKVSRQGATSFCESVIEAGWLLAVIVTPLFFNIYSSRIFEPDKAALLRSLAVLVLAAWLIESLCRRPGDIGNRVPPPWALPRHPLAMPVLVIALAHGVATAFSVVPRASLVGSYFRLQGTLTTLAYLTLFAAAATHLRHTDQVNRVLGCVALSSLPVALYALVQHQGWDPLQPWVLAWDTDVTARPPANFGNPIFLGGYLAMSALIVLGLVTIRIRRLFATTAPGLLDVGVTIGYGFVLVLDLVAMVLTQSRGPLVAFFAGLICYWCLAAAVPPLRRLALVALLLLLTLPAGAIALMKVTAGTGERALGRLTRWESILDTQVGGVGGRAAIWRGVLELFASGAPLELSSGGVDVWHRLRPVIGYGPESLAMTFHPSDHPDVARIAGRPVLVDRAHNETLDTLATTGLLGVIGYLWLFTAIIHHALRSLGSLSSPKARQRFSAIAMISAALTSSILWLWKGPAFLGLAIPLGIVAGMLLYVGLLLWPRSSSRVASLGAPGAEASLVLISLLAAIVAHFVEINFGVATVATRTHFWIFAALLVLQGTSLQASTFGDDASSNLAPQEAHGRATAATTWREASVGVSLLAVVLVTLGHDYFVFDIRTASWGRLFLRGTAGAWAGVPSGAALGLFFTTWLVGCLVVLGMATPTERARRWEWGWAAWGTSLVLGVLAWLLRGLELTNLARMTPSDLSSMLVVGDRIARLYTTYALFLLALLFVLAQGLSAAGGAKEPSGVAPYHVGQPSWTGRKIVTCSLVAACALWVAYTVSLRPIQADTLYNVGRQLGPGRRQLTIGLYQRASDLALYEDYYALELRQLLGP